MHITLGLVALKNRIKLRKTRRTEYNNTILDYWQKKTKTSLHIDIQHLFRLCLHAFKFILLHGVLYNDILMYIIKSHFKPLYLSAGYQKNNTVHPSPHCNATECQCFPFTAIAGLVFLLLSLKLRHEDKLGMHHWSDLADFSLMDTRSSLMVLSLLEAELAPERYGVVCADLGRTSCIVGLTTSFFPLPSPSWSSLTLSWKRSNSFFFFSGEGWDWEPGVLFW